MALLVLGAGTLLPNSSLSFSRTLSEASLPTASSLSICFSALQRQPPPSPLVYCGRGDRKTAKGKRFNHSFGNARPRDKKKKGRGPPRAPMPPAPPRKDRFDDDEVVKIDIDESLFS